MILHQECVLIEDPVVATNNKAKAKKAGKKHRCKQTWVDADEAHAVVASAKAAEVAAKGKTKRKKSAEKGGRNFKMNSVVPHAIYN